MCKTYLCLSYGLLLLQSQQRGLPSLHRLNVVALMREAVDVDTVELGGLEGAEASGAGHEIDFKKYKLGGVGVGGWGGGGSVVW